VYIIVTVTEINGDEDGEVVTLSTQYLSQLTSQVVTLSICLS